MSVSSIIGGGIRLIRTQPRIVAVWAGLYLIAITVGMMVFRPFMTSITEFQRQVAANKALGIRTPPKFPAGLFGSMFLIDLIYAVVAVIAFAAVVRATAWPSRDRFVYLRLGKDELRLFGLGIILFIAALIAEIVVVVVVMLVALLMGLIFGKAGAGIIAGVLGIAVLCFALYVEVRISLAGALTVLHGRIVIKDAWRTTKGQFWTLFAAYLLLALAFLVATIVFLAVTNPTILSAYASFDPQTMNAAAQQQFARQMSGWSVGFIIQMIVGGFFAVGMTVIAFGAIATAATELGQAIPTAPAE